MARITWDLKRTAESKQELEDLIAGQLRMGNVAEVAIADLGQGYALEDVPYAEGDDKFAEATQLAAQCAAICEKLSENLRSPVEYNKEGDGVSFYMVTARPK